ncbi:MAG: trypsin-like peptidase domain-containing protein [Lapillicoccus sp.]
MRGTWDPRIASLAASVTPDIPRIRAVLDRMGIRNADSADPVDYVASAFALAAAQGRARAFQAELVKADLVISPVGGQPGAVDIEAELYEQLAVLQSFTSGVFRPTDAKVAARRMLLACDLVCSIEVDREQKGTGVLVGPTLVATAAHVVSELVTVSAAGAARIGAGSCPRIQVTFGDVEELLDNEDRPTRMAGTVAPLAASWLASYSPPAASEIAGMGFLIDSLDGIDPDAGPWDVAILRLAEARPYREGRSLTNLPRKPFQIHVLHHPSDPAGKALPMLWSIGSLDRPLGDPPLRMLHSANTQGGSSGAPVFDSEFRVIGLHQAGGPTPLAGDEARNRAVPVLPWAPALAAIAHGSAAPPVVRSVSVVDAFGQSVECTVIGRRTTQERIWRSVSPDATPQERLLAVLGAPGLGLRFTKYLVHDLATRFGGTYASLDVANCQSDTAADFADRLAGAFAVTAEHAVSSGLTTSQRDVRNATAPGLATTLDTLAGSGGAWLVLEGFDSTLARPSAAVLDLVRQLVLELPRARRLRLVLAGWQESLPVGFEASAEYLLEPTPEDVIRTLLPADATDDAVAAVLPLVRGELQKVMGESAGERPYDVAELARVSVAGQVAPLLAYLLRGGAGE